MPAPAAVSGTYSDLKLIKTRKVAVICVEIPLEEAERFVAAFGMPNPGAEKWVAVARIHEPGSKPQEAQGKRKLSDLPPAQQAALTCQREAFRRFLWEGRGVAVENEEEAASYVRDFCKVRSRADIAGDAGALQRWNLLLSAFETWMGQPQAGAA